MNYNIEDFFDMSKPLQRIHISSASRKYAIRPPEENPYPDPAPMQQGHAYAEPFQEAAQKEFIESYTKNREKGTINTLSQMSDLTSNTLGAMSDQMPGAGLTNVYEKFNFRKPKPNNLSINSKHDEILGSINSSQVTIIEGATGCGKTTQVPQFILDDCCKKNVYCNIIVTQPRKIAAISIAKRVCKERGWPLGELVGYQVGLDSKTNDDTRLQYVTTGVLLQRLANEHNMNKYTHIILDEVHERDQEMDFTLLVVRKLQRTNSSFVKVVLMSATFNTLKFSQYFAIPGDSTLVPSPIIKISDQSEFVVKIIYVDMIKSIGEIYNNDIAEPKIDPRLYHTTTKLIMAFDELDTLDYELKNGSKANTKQDIPIGSVLIFLPGIFEIESHYEELYKQLRLYGLKWHLVPLHSSITSEEQQCVFRSAPKGFRKIILSTNIAESSITVPDVKYVIDFCLSKELVAAEDSNFSVLQMIWASKANCDQRAGRVGRVADGRVYRMVTKHFYDFSLKNECRPEMVRAPLSRLILLSKQLHMGSPTSVLAVAMDPPDIRNILNTVLHLKEIGGLLPSVSGEFETSDGDMTLLGHVMAALPLDVHISKLIFLGWIFDCLDETIIMGAAMSLKSIFNNSFFERMKTYDSKLIWADGCMSDPISFYNAYRVWKHSRQQKHFSRTANAESAWAERFCLQAKVMNEISALELELKTRLKRMHITPLKGTCALHWLEGEKKLLYKTVLAGAFYPNYFLRSSHVDEYDAVKTLGGRDPYTTVYFSGMDTKQPGELYVKHIKKALSECNRDLKVEFDSSTKVYVTFGTDRNTKSEFDKELKLNSTIPGKIPLSVYKAIKMRHLNISVVLKVMKHDQSIRLAEERGIGKFNCSSWETNSAPRSLKTCLPGVTVKYVSYRISHFEDCGRFWVQPIEMASVLENIKKTLNEKKGKNLKRFDNSYKPYVGQFCAAIYEEEYHRVRIIDSGYCEEKLMYKVFYVDYGNALITSVNELRAFGNLENFMMSQPACSYEVILAEVKPSEVRDVGANWLDEANNRFIDITHNQELNGQVYSVVNGIVACTVYLNSLNLNDWLVQQNYGHFCEESYQSKCNYDVRLSVDRYTEEQLKSHNLAQEASMTVYGDVEPPEQIDCKYSLRLKGPFSPLEAQVYPILLSAHAKRALVDPNSVNSILLTTTPQYGSEPLIVAAEVAQSQQNQTVILRNTTVMPNIDGLPAIMSMLFCPCMKLFTNEKWTRYTQVLCGLGCDKLEHPLYKEHDLLLSLNVVIENDDIKKINKIRSYMGQLMSYTPNVLDTPQVIFDHLKCGYAMKNLLKDLWGKKRRIVDNSNSRVEVTSWKISPEYKENLLRLAYSNDPLKQVYPLHKVLKLKPDVVHDVGELLQFNDYLEELCRRTQITTEVFCRICELRLQSVSQLRIHVLSRAHRELVSRLQTCK